MKSKKRTPYQISGLAFLAAFIIAVCAIVAITLLPLPVDKGGIIEVISNATCPVGIAAGLIAYFWARNAQAEQQIESSKGNKEEGHQPRE